MTDYTPIKTEYKGIVFDSKSEAVFARTLDLAFYDGEIGDWFYHPLEEGSCNHDGIPASLFNPNDGEIKSHPWDFLIVTPEMKRYYVEYKPSQPTMTYVNNLTLKSAPYFKKRDWAGRYHSIIIWGNPWDGIQRCSPYPECSYIAYPIFCHGEYGWGDFCPMADSGYDRPTSSRHIVSEMFNIYEEMAQEAKRYRFDLQN